MRSTKYSPAFQLSDASTADDTKMEITFVEFDEAKVTPTTEEAGPGAEQSPVIGLPLRNQTYEDSGIQGNLQMKAPRLMENGNMTLGESIIQEKEYLAAKEEHYQQENDEEENGGFSFSFTVGEGRK